MNEIASAGQLRMSLLRWILVCVPLLVVLGSLSGIISNSGYSNAWFTSLDRPDIVPPGWVFGAVWTTLYIMMGLALAMIINARGAAGRGRALALFAAQFLLNLAWSPLFFGAHQVSLAFWLILAILGLTIATSFAFAAIRKTAAWLLVPYMVWLSFASILNYKIDQLNPDAENKVPPAASATISIEQSGR